MKSNERNVDKEKYCWNTLVFVGMRAYILLFGVLFGQNDILIGVSTITTLLVLLERESSNHPVQDTVKFAKCFLFA